MRDVRRTGHPGDDRGVLYDYGVSPFHASRVVRTLEVAWTSPVRAYSVTSVIDKARENVNANSGTLRAAHFGGVRGFETRQSNPLPRSGFESLGQDAAPYLPLSLSSLVTSCELRSRFFRAPGLTPTRKKKKKPK